MVAVVVGPAAGASAAHSKSTTTTTIKTSNECQATQLSYAVNGTLSGVAGQEAFVMGVQNVAKTTCRIHGYPSLRFYTNAGRLLTFGTTHKSVMFKTLPTRVLSLAPYHFAYFVVAKGLCPKSVRYVSSFFYVITPYSSDQPWVGHFTGTGVRPLQYCDASSHAQGQTLGISTFATSPSQLNAK